MTTLVEAPVAGIAPEAAETAATPQTAAPKASGDKKGAGYPTYAYVNIPVHELSKADQPHEHKPYVPATPTEAATAELKFVTGSFASMKSKGFSLGISSVKSAEERFAKLDKLIGEGALKPEEVTQIIDKELARVKTLQTDTAASKNGAFLDTGVAKANPSQIPDSLSYDELKAATMEHITARTAPGTKKRKGDDPVNYYAGREGQEFMAGQEQGFRHELLKEAMEKQTAAKAQR